MGVLRQIEGRTVKHDSSSGYRGSMADMGMHERSQLKARLL